MRGSDNRLRSGGRAYSFSLADGDWFYFAGIWRSATPGWPEAYAVLTVDANPDVAPYHDRQMMVLRREQRLDWLDGLVAENALLRPLPRGSFQVRGLKLNESRQRALAF